MGHGDPPLRYNGICMTGPEPLPTDEPRPAQRNLADRITRRRAAAIAGHTGDAGTARLLLTDPDPGVRGTALGALARAGALTADELRAVCADPQVAVRRRAVEVLATWVAPTDDELATETEPGAADDHVSLLPLLRDQDPSVVEMAAWAAGEILGRAAEAGSPLPEPEVVDELMTITIGHADALCREAAVAALGAVGDERALPAILTATTDKATVRRRAIIALAPFDGPAVDDALATARTDRDWQVRQAAEDLLAIQADAPPDPNDPNL